MLAKILEHQDKLEQMGSLRFNIHRVAEKIGRPALLSVMTVNAIKKLHLHEAFDKIDYSRMSSFLSKIY